MIVVDASIVVALIASDQSLGQLVRAELAEDAEWAAPEHLTIEAASAVRGLWLGGRSSDSNFDRQLQLLQQIELSVFATAPLLPRIRALAANATAYDAAYLVLAERLNIRLLTIDRNLATVPGVDADVRVIEPH